MSIRPISSSQGNPSFGHTFKVSICVKDAATQGYNFVSPIKDKKLYKELNSKVVGWLNEKYLANIRKELNHPRKTKKYQSDHDKWSQNYLSKCLYNLDEDYRQFNTVRSVYNRYGLTYFATGIDVPVIENLKGAKQIGIAKSEALLDYGVTHTPYVEEVVDAFKRNSINYAKDKFNLLRSSNGKEIMLKLDFGAPRVNAKGKTVYDLENVNFYEIQKSTPLTKEEQLIAASQKDALWGVLKQTVKRQVSKITGQSTAGREVEDFLNPLREPPKKPKKLKKDPRQLELFG